MDSDFIRTLDAVKLSEVLLSENISPSVVEKLKNVGFRGENFFSFDKEDYLELDLNIPLPEIIQLRILCKKHKKLSNEPMLEKKTIPAAKPIPVHDKKELTRTFMVPVANNQSYTIGSLVPHEIGRGSSLLEPTREFKEFSLGNIKIHDEKLQRKFLEKVAKFSSACLNSRINGTIYFGVSDSKEGKKHGEISGMHLGIHQLYVLEDLLHKYFRGSNPAALVNCTKEAKKAFDLAIGPIQAIGTNNPNKIILEIDVEPRFELTKYLAFPINLENKKEPKYFIRDGPNSVPITEKGKNKFLSHDISYNAHQRQDQEKKLAYSEMPLPMKMESLFMRNQRIIDDKHHHFILITNDLCSEECCRMKNWFAHDWIKLIQWKAVFDFDSDGLAKFLQDSNHLLLKPNFIEGGKIKEQLEKDPSHFDEEIKKCFGIRTAWITAAGEGSLKNWNSNLKKAMMRVIEAITNKSKIESHSKLIFVLCSNSDKNVKKIASFVKEISSELDNGISSMIFLHKDQKHFKPIEEELLRDCEASEQKDVLQDISQRKVEIEWEHLNTFVKENSRIQTISAKLIPTSNGLKTPIKREIVDIYTSMGLNILSMNECECILGEDDVTTLANQSNMDFLRGKQSGWEPYFFKEESDRLPFSKPVIKGLIERDIVKKIVKKLKNDENKSDSCVTITGINHQPGTGATTIGKHVMWKLRSDFRCVLLDGKESSFWDYKELANKILEFRSFGEHQSTVNGSRVGSSCRPVLIFVDNFTHQEAKILQQHIQQHNHQEIRHSKPIGMILYTRHNYEDSKVLSSEEGDFSLNTRFSDNEKRLFTAKLSELEKENKIAPLDMLAFIVFVHGDENKSSNPYLDELTEKLLRSMDSYPLQRQLLYFLAIFKYHGDTNIILGQYFASKGNNFIANLCSPVKMLVREISVNGINVLEITHKPIAKLLVEKGKCLEEKSVHQFLEELLSKERMMKKRFLKEKLANDLKNIFIKRNIDKGEKDNFSLLIMEANDESIYLPLLLFSSIISAFEKYGLENYGLPLLFQTLSRYQYLNNEQFEEAEETIGKAILMRPNNGAFYDTLGQIFKQQLRRVVRVQNQQEVNLDLAFQFSYEASTNFKMAQKLFKSMIEKIHGGVEKTNDYIPIEFVANSPAYFGEIEVILTIGETVVKRCKNDVEKEAMRDYMQGKLVEVGAIFEDSAIDNVNKYLPMLAKVYQRTQIATDAILKRLDSRSLKYDMSKGKTALQETLQRLGEVNKRWKSLFLESRFSKICDLFNSKKPWEVKLRYGRLFIQMNLLHSVYFLRSLTHNDLYGAKQVIEMFFCVLKENNLEIFNSDKLCFLNMVTSNPDYSMMTFQEASKLSSDLAQTKSEQSESFLWYLLYHWPNNDTLTEYYDEDKLLRCIKKMKEISAENAWEINPVDNSRMGPKHSPLYFLSDGLEFRRFVTDRHHSEYRKSVAGTIVNDKCVEMIFPKGKKIKIRAAHLFMNRHLDAFSSVNFELAFTLEGPVAFNIRRTCNQHESLKSFNDAGIDFEE